MREMLVKQFIANNNHFRCRIVDRFRVRFCCSFFFRERAQIIVNLLMNRFSDIFFTVMVVLRAVELVWVSSFNLHREKNCSKRLKCLLYSYGFCVICESAMNRLLVRAVRPKNPFDAVLYLPLAFLGAPEKVNMLLGRLCRIQHGPVACVISRNSNTWPAATSFFTKFIAIMKHLKPVKFEWNEWNANFRYDLTIKFNPMNGKWNYRAIAIYVIEQTKKKAIFKQRGKTGDSGHHKLILIEREKSNRMLRTTRRRTANRITFSSTSLSTFILMPFYLIRIVRLRNWMTVCVQHRHAQLSSVFATYPNAFAREHALTVCAT